jgi:beta-glucosidase
MDALANGTITEGQIDDSVHRMLTSMYTIGLFDHKPVGVPLANVTSDEHNALAREISAKATVLLKNENKRLPLSLASVKQIAVIGRDDIVSGDGSGHVTPGHIITPAQGLQNAIDRAGLTGSVKVVYNKGKDSSDVRDLAAASDVVIVLVATKSCEGIDRPTLSLGSDQDALVTTAASANPSGTIVVVTSPGAVLLPWLDAVPAVLMNWLPGQEAGDALADVLTGAVNPSARLPITIPHKDNEMAFTQAQYPGVGKPPEAAYSEGLQVGYRWYEANKVDPVFPFGYGLSYTTFGYANPTWQRTDVPKRSGDFSDVVGVVSVEVTNTGDVSGAEVVQLYLTFPSSTGEPPNQLKGFVKAELQPKETRTVHFALRRRDLSIWDASAHAWALQDGLYVAKIGSSSRDLPLKVSFAMA